MSDTIIIMIIAAITIVAAASVPCATAAYIVARTGTTDGIAEILRAVADIVHAATAITGSDK